MQGDGWIGWLIVEWVRCGWIYSWLSGCWFCSMSRLMDFFSDFLKGGERMIRWTDWWECEWRYSFGTPAAWSVFQQKSAVRTFCEPASRQTRLIAYKYSSQTGIWTCRNVAVGYKYIRTLKPVGLVLLLGMLHSGQAANVFGICPWDEYQPEGSGSGLLSGSEYSRVWNESAWMDWRQLHPLDRY
jgi:hypothetical protein